MPTIEVFAKIAISILWRDTLRHVLIKLAGYFRKIGVLDFQVFVKIEIYRWRFTISKSISNKHASIRVTISYEIKESVINISIM